jgi:uncharacterized membrane-anchored protein
MAKIGLTALVAGGLGAAAAKAGLLAKLALTLKGFWVFLLVGMKKLWILVIAAISGLWNKLFGKKQADSSPVNQSPNDSDHQ